MRAPNFKIVELKAGAKVKNVPGTSAYPRSRFHNFKDEWESKASPHYKGTRLSKNLRRVWPGKCTTCPRTFKDTSKQCTVCGLAAHVWVHPDDGPDAQVWLVPRCHWCNQADGVKGRKVTGKWVTLVEDSFAVTIDEFNHKCDFCDEKFFSKRGVGQHEKKVHPKKSEEKCSSNYLFYIFIIIIIFYVFFYFI